MEFIKELLVGLFLLGLLTGIIPILLVAFAEAHTWFAVLIGIFDVIWIFAELWNATAEE